MNCKSFYFGFTQSKWFWLWKIFVAKIFYFSDIYALTQTARMRRRAELDKMKISELKDGECEWALNSEYLHFMFQILCLPSVYQDLTSPTFRADLCLNQQCTRGGQTTSTRVQSEKPSETKDSVQASTTELEPGIVTFQQQNIIRTTTLQQCPGKRESCNIVKHLINEHSCCW